MLVVDDEAGAGAADARVGGDGVDGAPQRVREHEGVGVGGPQEVDAERVGDDEREDVRREHDALLVHVALADAQLAHAVGPAEADVLLLEDGAGELDAVAHGDVVALRLVDVLAVVLAHLDDLGADVLCHVAQGLRDVDCP